MNRLPSVASVILNPQRNQVLLVKRRDVDSWVLPGGGVDPHEPPQVAAIRECLEETGLTVTISRQVAKYTPLNRLARITYVYECVPISGEITQGLETQEIAYFPINNLPKKFFFIHKEWLEDALKNLPEIIEKPLSSVTYLKLLKHFFSHPIDTLRFALSRLGFPLNS